MDLIKEKIRWIYVARMAGMGWVFSILIRTPSVSAQNLSVGYYPAWARAEYGSEDIPLKNLTHVIHAFAWPLADGRIVSYAEIPDPGLVNAVHQAGKKIFIALGGWGNSDGFSPMAASSTARSAFVSNLIEFMTRNGYDGVDLDWEFPQSQADKANGVTLVRDIREAFAGVDSSWKITMAVNPGDWIGQWMDYDNLVPQVDWFNAMTYDFHGSWTSHAGHNAPLYAPATDDDGSVHEGITYLTETRKIPKAKVLLGIPFYGREFAAASLYAPQHGTADLFFGDALAKCDSGWTYHWDAVSCVPYLTDPRGSRLVTFDDTASVRLKCEYALASGLGGVMIWALGEDVFGNRQPLLQTIAEELFSSTGLGSDGLKRGMKAFSLEPNFPNPFNASTTIRFRADSQGPLSVVVFDLGGREIGSFSGQIREPGTFSLSWDGSCFPSGVYFYRIQAGPFCEARPMLLVK
jgi:chitinase